VPGVDLPNNWARCLEIQIHTLTSALDLVTAEFITRRAYDRQIRRRLDRLAATRRSTSLLASHRFPRDIILFAIRY
jgi:hypothetical protein